MKSTLNNRQFNSLDDQIVKKKLFQPLQVVLLPQLPLLLQLLQLLRLQVEV